MEPITLIRPDLCRFRNEAEYRAWEQGPRHKAKAAQRPNFVSRLISSIRNLISSRQIDNEAAPHALGQIDARNVVS